MSTPAPRTTTAPSIRVVVCLFLVVPVLVAAGTVALLADSTGRRIAEDLGASVVYGVADDVESQLRLFLDQAVRVSDLYAARIAEGTLPSSGFTDSPWERAMFDDLRANPGVASICFANPPPREQAVMLLRGRGGRLELGRVDGPAEGRAIELTVDPATGQPVELIRHYRYVASSRPWYTLAQQSSRPVWTPPYSWFGDSGAESILGAGYTRQVRSPGGELLGALVIDVTLSSLSTFLKSLPFSEHGAAFIVDERGLLIAASHGAVTDARGERLDMARSEAPVARRAAVALAAPDGNSHATRRVTLTDDDLPRGPARVAARTITPYPGIAWRLITVLPESAFLGEAQAARSRLLALTLLAGVGAAALAFLLSRRLAAPVLRLREHVQRVGAGDFASRLNLSAARELAELSTDLNKMAGDLKDRMELQKALEVATQVQQGLLPSGPPSIPGLDIAGHSDYCDATGGDYYDFIDVAQVPPGVGSSAPRLLIAVGDVMGHGIGAALLMATARAAIRSAAPDALSLGDLLTKVNHVIADDSRHNQFVTMLLMLIEPRTGVCRWASAGHDPPLILKAARTTGTHADFDEPDGGYVPLGILPDSQYEEYTYERLEPGDTMVIGTDGIWEAHPPDPPSGLPGLVNGHPVESAAAPAVRATVDLFGKQRLRDAIRAGAGTSRQGTAADVQRAIIDGLAAYTRGRPFADDVTFVVVKRT